MNKENLEKIIEEQIRINVVYVSTKDGIDRKHCDEFPKALAPQICTLAKEAGYIHIDDVVLDEEKIQKILADDVKLNRLLGYDLFNIAKTLSSADILTTNKKGE